MKQLFFIIFFLFSFHSFAQCSSDSFYDSCSTNLGKAIFIKAYNISSTNFKKGESSLEYGYIYSKGTTYIITACDTENNKMIVELYDRTKKIIASNYDKTNRTFNPKISYSCSETGVYYSKYKFKNETEGCGISLLGFIK